MRIGISTACLYPGKLEEALDVLADLGVGLIEVFFNTESEFEKSFYMELGRKTEKRGIEVVSVHPYTSLIEGLLFFSEYGRRTEDGLKQYGRYFACAAYLGARYFTFHGERELGFKDTPERWKRKCESYHKLCALAESKSITLAQENVNWCRSREPDFIRALCRDVPELRYTLDVKQARRAGRSWKEFIEIEKGKLVNIHISDYTEKESCVLPGKGELDYSGFFSELKNAGYGGDALVEVYRSDYREPEELETAKEHLTKYLL